MPLTTTDLTVRVLDLLGVTQVGQDSYPEDVEKVASFIPSTVDMLADERVASIDPANISPGVFEQFAIVVASAASPSFGQPRDKDTIAAEKDALRLAQAAEGGAFSRRRMEFSGSAQRQLQAGQGFAGTDKAPLAASQGFAGTTRSPLAVAQGFAGTDKAPLAASQGFAGTTRSPLAVAQGFAGAQERQLNTAPGFAGATERPLNASSGLAGTVQRPLQGAK